MLRVGDTSQAPAEATLASGATTDLGSAKSMRVVVTGTTAITSFGSAANRLVFLRFAASLVLTYNATSLILPGAASITTAAGDTAVAISDSSGNWTVRDYLRASGKPLTGPASADIIDASTSGRTVLTGTAAQGASALSLGTGDSPTFSALTVSGTLSAGLVAISGATAIYRSGDYTIINNIAAGTGAVSIGNSDPSTYHKNNTHYFQSKDGSKLLATIGANGVSSNGYVQSASYTVATVPAGASGAMIFVSNARKVGEAAGSGTGVIACYSNSNWRRLSDDTAIAA